MKSTRIFVKSLTFCIDWWLIYVTSIYEIIGNRAIAATLTLSCNCSDNELADDLNDDDENDSQRNVLMVSISGDRDVYYLLVLVQLHVIKITDCD